MGIGTSHPTSVDQTLFRVASGKGSGSADYLLPARVSEQGNVIGSVRIILYNYNVYKKIVIERTRDLIYFKFVATDFFLKIISPSAGENSGDLA